MSVGSQELDRSILERKDRDELVAIAEAFGQKPASRTKKADIVDLILDLTGVGSGSSNAGEAPEEADAKPKRARPRPKTNGSQADSGAAADADADAPESGTGTEAPSRSEAQPSTERGAAEAPTASPAEAPGPATTAAGSAPVAAGQAHRDATEQGRPDDSAQEAQPGEQGHTAGSDQKTEQGEQSEQSRNDQPTQRQAQNGQGQQARQHQGGNQGNGNNQGGGSQGNQGNSQGGGNRGGQQNGGGDAEPGNRRRRRRNRDRDREQRPQTEEVFQGEPVDVEGLLDLRDEGYGFLRLKGYLPSKDDVYVSVKQVRQFSLRKGDHLKGASRPATRQEKNPALLRIDEVNGKDPDKARQRPRFEDLTPLFPDEKLRLEVDSDPGNMTARIVDLLSPIGKGQRGLIVSPPKAGKTTVMKTIARSIETNNPEAHLIVLLVDERPEEVTDFRRWLTRGEVAASTFDRPSDEHTHVSELVIERAKRMVEEGKDVVIILDGITRLARAYNLAAPASGRIMSGGIDAGALYPPKKFFGAARNVEEGGSLTILATALVETNSRMDDHIFEEFKGTGNMELKLDRKLADRRIYPAIDVDASGTRHEELLFERRQLQQVWKLRRVLSGLSADGGTNAPGLELLVDRMKTFKSNDEFLAEIAKAPSIS